MMRRGSCHSAADIQVHVWGYCNKAQPATRCMVGTTDKSTWKSVRGCRCRHIRKGLPGSSFACSLWYGDFVFLLNGIPGLFRDRWTWVGTISTGSNSPHSRLASRGKSHHSNLNSSNCFQFGKRRRQQLLVLTCVPTCIFTCIDAHMPHMEKKDHRGCQRACNSRASPQEWEASEVTQVVWRWKSISADCLCVRFRSFPCWACTFPDVESRHCYLSKVWKLTIGTEARGVW